LIQSTLKFSVLLCAQGLTVPDKGRGVRVGVDAARTDLIIRAWQPTVFAEQRRTFGGVTATVPDYGQHAWISCAGARIAADAVAQRGSRAGEGLEQIADETGRAFFDRDFHAGILAMSSRSDHAARRRFAGVGVFDEGRLGVRVRGFAGIDAEPGSIDGPARQRGQSTGRAEIDQLDTLLCQRRRQASVLSVDLAQPRRERMAAGGPEKMIVGEIHADQADPACAHVRGQTDRDIRRILGVVQHLARMRVGAAVLTQTETYLRWPGRAEFELREQHARVGALDECVAIALELLARVEHDQIGRVEQSTDVVDANKHRLLRPREIQQRRPAAADDDVGAGVAAAVVAQARGGGERGQGGVHPATTQTTVMFLTPMS
jgi:hypothetical protein